MYFICLPEIYGSIRNFVKIYFFIGITTIYNKDFMLFYFKGDVY